MKKFNQIIVYTILILIVFINLSHAGTDGAELQSAYDKIVGLITGIGGKIIAITSWAFSIVGCFAKFNFAAVATSFGVAIATTVAPLVVNSTVTAMLNF